MTSTVINADCLEALAAMPTDSVDAVVTDPPYELGFMGKKWDASGIAYDVNLWIECLRVLKPGGHLLSFGGTRTYHRMACAVEDAGFEIRDSITWLYGSGFPKSLDVSKAIDKAAGAARNIVGGSPNQRPHSDRGNGLAHGTYGREFDLTEPATDAAEQWAGFGTALKPASEPIVVARKPFAGTVAANVLAHSTGALNIDACRVQYADAADRNQASVPQSALGVKTQCGVYGFGTGEGRTGERFEPPTAGRWPANVVLSHARDCDDVCAPGCPVTELDEPARFFPVFRYQAKAPTRERPKIDGVAHPTVKPLELMRWLVRLVTPPGGTVLDPFAGSGTTVEAALLEGFDCIAVERDASYLPLIQARIDRVIG